MAYKIIDMHTHTDNSPDGRHSAMYMCEQAYMSGIRALAITDHVEADFFKDKKYDIIAYQSFLEATKAKYAFRGEMIVCAGVELGQPMYNVRAAERLISGLPYDIVVGSVHNLRGMEDFWYLDYSKYDVDRLIREYFNELLLMAEWGKFDTLAHLTYPLRYIVGEHNIKVNLDMYMPQIDEVLKALVKNKKALEINTSGLRQKIGVTLPDEDIIRRFKELGGEMVTVGSDAHLAQDLGKGIEEGMRLAKKCGFDSVTLFQKRMPVQIPIEETE